MLCFRFPGVRPASACGFGLTSQRSNDQIWSRMSARFDMLRRFRPLALTWRITCTQTIMTKTGTIETLNVSPKGFYEGFLLKSDAGISQINFPKDENGTLNDTFRTGEFVTVEVDQETPHGTPAHQVFRMVRLRGADNASNEDHQGERTFSGRIKTLNFALHGEVNGGILDSGDFIHLKPKGARAVELAIGMNVEGRGHAKAMPGGHLVIDAEEVNGITIENHEPGKNHKRKH